jgi:exodeoxyribonuclease-3
MRNRAATRVAPEERKAPKYCRPQLRVDEFKTRPSATRLQPLASRMNLKITTWNINSVRLRINLVAKFIKIASPDVICLQETKCPDSKFPLKRFARLGYPHVALNGQKGYHGVAILSRFPLDSVDARAYCGKSDSRHLAVKIGERAGLPAQLTVHNFYVPAGGDEPDPAINEKFAHKLAFLDEMRVAPEMRLSSVARAILVGDLNVAPLEHDVWSHKQMLKVVSHTPIECEKLTAVQKAGGWFDVPRAFVPEPAKLYTWWSYRARDWQAADRGRRLDHIWVSPAMADRVVGMTITKQARGWAQPSDHVPVTAVLEL